MQNYIGRLQEILIDDSTRTKPDVKAKATELLKSMGMKPPTAAAAPPNPQGGLLAPSGGYPAAAKTTKTTKTSTSI